MADVLGSLDLPLDRIEQRGIMFLSISSVADAKFLNLLSVESAIDSFVNLAFADLKRLKVVCVEVRVGDSGSVVALNTSGLKFKIQTSLDRGIQDPHPLLSVASAKEWLLKTYRRPTCMTFPRFLQTFFTKKVEVSRQLLNSRYKAGLTQEVYRATMVHLHLVHRLAPF